MHRSEVIKTSSLLPIDGRAGPRQSHDTPRPGRNDDGNPPSSL
jgi:hypothetical protein